MYTRRFVALAGLAVLGGLTPAARADIKLELRSSLTQTACLGQEFDVGLFAATTNPNLFESGEGFVGIQVVLAWDPTVLELMGASTAGSPIFWSLRTFLANDPGGLNELAIPKDGDAFYLLTTQLSNNPPRATQAGVLLVAFSFKAILQTTESTAIRILSEGGSPVSLTTLVADAINPGLDILDSSGGTVVTQFAIPVTCTRTFAELLIQGPTIVPAGSSGQCRAIAVFQEGFSLDVTTVSSWQILSGPGTIDAATGIYTAPGAITGSVEVRVKATWVDDNGMMRMQEKVFTVIEQPDDRVLTGLTVDGPSSIDENTTSQCTATAFFESPASPANVTSLATWQVTSGPGTISSTGLYFAPNLDQDVLVTVRATYTENGRTRSDEKTFIVNDLTVVVPVLVDLTIVGPPLVQEGRIASYSAIATFSDGSQESQADVTVSSDWSVFSGPGEFNASVPGEYQAPTSVGGPTPVTIQAEFMHSTGSEIATLNITVIQPEAAVDLVFRGCRLIPPDGPLGPVTGQFEVGDTFRCELYAVSNASFDQAASVIEAILTWDRFVLELIGAEQPDSIFSTSGITPGDLHNCNEADPPADGTAIFVGTAGFDRPVIATPEGTLIAFILLKAIAPGTGRLEIIKEDCDLFGVPPRLAETTVVSALNPGLDITGLLGFSQITIAGDAGAPVVVSRLPVPDDVLNRKADPNNPTNAGRDVSVRFSAPTTNVDIQVVGVQNGARTGVLTASDGGSLHTLTFSSLLPDRDRYNVTVRVGGVIVSQAQWSFVKLVGDCNKNRQVEILDAGQLRNALRTNVYDINCDFNGNGSNDIFDLSDLRAALKDGAFVP